MSDYTSEELNLKDPKVYRDLSKPMGCQTKKREEKFKERFNLWDLPETPAYHYGTHYSSAMIVCTYLLRVEPFTRNYISLQGGSFDHADRLFHSIEYSYNLASGISTSSTYGNFLC